jgi:hypothetical protein
MLSKQALILLGYLFMDALLEKLKDTEVSGMQLKEEDSDRKEIFVR